MYIYVYNTFDHNPVLLYSIHVPNILVVYQICIFPLYTLIFPANIRAHTQIHTRNGGVNGVSMWRRRRERGLGDEEDDKGREGSCANERH